MRSAKRSDPPLSPAASTEIQRKQQDLKSVMEERIPPER